MVDFKARVGKIEGELETFCHPERKEEFQKQSEQVCHTSQSGNTFQLPKLEQFRNKMSNAVLAL